MESRKVQRVGYSTLAVSLPKDWASEVGLKQGDVVTFKRDEDGSLRVYPGLERERKETIRAVINADLCDRNELLTRILTGNYILGHDTIQIVSRDELKPAHLEEIRRTTQRLTGLGIVEQTLKQVIVQSFVDPTKFPVDGLIRRLHIVTSSMQEAAIRALVERRPELATEVLHMEEEADRIYWLIVRQLLLAVRDRSVATKIGIASPMHIVGNRVVAKSLEEMADCAEGIAKEMLQIKAQDFQSMGSLLDGVAQFSKLVQSISDKAVKAILSQEIKMANDVITSAEMAEKEERKLTERILAQGHNIRMVAALRSIVWNLAQILKYCDIIAEITINRVLEEPTEISKFEKS